MLSPPSIYQPNQAPELWCRLHLTYPTNQASELRCRLHLSVHLTELRDCDVASIYLSIQSSLGTVMSSRSIYIHQTNGYVTSIYLSNRTSLATVMPPPSISSNQLWCRLHLFHPTSCDAASIHSIQPTVMSPPSIYQPKQISELWCHHHLSISTQPNQQLWCHLHLSIHSTELCKVCDCVT